MGGARASARPGVTGGSGETTTGRRREVVGELAGRIALVRRAARVPDRVLAAGIGGMTLAEHGLGVRRVPTIARVPDLAVDGTGLTMGVAGPMDRRGNVRTGMAAGVGPRAMGDGAHPASEAAASVARAGQVRGGQVDSGPIEAVGSMAVAPGQTVSAPPGGMTPVGPLGD